MRPFLNAKARRTTVASGTSAVELVPARNRFGGVIWNRSSAILYVLLPDPSAAETVSATVATQPIAAGAIWQIPEGYTGAINGIWASANADCQITEYA